MKSVGEGRSERRVGPCESPDAGGGEWVRCERESPARRSSFVRRPRGQVHDRAHAQSENLGASPQSCSMWVGRTTVWKEEGATDVVAPAQEYGLLRAVRWVWVIMHKGEFARNTAIRDCGGNNAMGLGWRSGNEASVNIVAIAQTQRWHSMSRGLACGGYAYVSFLNIVEAQVSVSVWMCACVCAFVCERACRRFGCGFVHSAADNARLCLCLC